MINWTPDRRFEGRTVAVLASGPSMSGEVAASVAHLPRIVVNTTYRLAPDAEVLFAHDVAWWLANPEAQAFAGLRVCGQDGPIDARRVALPEERVEVAPGHVLELQNSGIAAIRLAAALGAARIELRGFDPGQPGHWHPEPPGPPLSAAVLAARSLALAGVVRELAARGVEVVGAPAPEPLKPEPLVVHGMGGFGDSIYMRPIIAEMARARAVRLATPWPEIFEDIPGVRFLRPLHALRTQAKNVARQPASRWDGAAPRDAGVSVSYHQLLDRETIPGAMAKLLGVTPREPMSLPPVALSPDIAAQLPAGIPLAIVRPVTRRAEWPAVARSPLAEYVATAARQARRQGCFVISVADIDVQAEVAEEPLPEARLSFLRGELGPRDLLALVARAAVVIGGVGWIVPAALAARVPGLIILGGLGAHNAPERIAPEGMQHGLRFLEPDAFCRCADMAHACAKTISRFESKAREELGRILHARPANRLGVE